MDTQAQPLRQNWYAVLLARPWVARMIATLGAVVVVVGLYVPVAGRDWMGRGVFASHYADMWTIGNFIGIFIGVSLGFLHVARVSLPLQLGVSIVLSVLQLGGLALTPLLWRPLSPKGTAALRWTYAAWLLLQIILAVAGFFAWRSYITQPIPGTPPFISSGAPPFILPAAVVFPIGVLISCVALALLFREPLPASALAIAPRTGWQWVASLTLTAGALIWLVGFYLMPETVTAACPPITFSVTQFIHGACAGLDSDQALAAAYSSGLNPIVFLLYTLGRHFELLVAAAGITALGGWTRRLSVGTLAWLATWPLLAFGVAFVALRGVSMLARSGFRLGFAAGSSWHVASGMIVTFVGIGLVVLGQLGLWRELARRRGVASAR